MLHRFIHLSDLHLIVGAGRQNMVVKECISDIKTRFVRSPPTKFLLSGDLSQNPDHENIYASVFSTLVEPLSRHFGMSLSDFIPCPGNHDISHTYLKRHKAMSGQLETQATRSGLLEDLEDEYVEFAHDVSKHFFEFSKTLAHPWQSPFVNIDTADDRFNILSINTAFSCSLKGSKHDEGKLLIGLNALEAVFASLPENRTTLVQMHHPIAHLAEPTRIRLQHLIDRYADFLFYGHLHKPRPRYSFGSTTPTTDVQAGALYQHSERFKSYAIVTFEADNPCCSQIEYRTYWDDRGIFDAATNIASNGQITSPSTLPEHFAAAEAKEPDVYSLIAIDAAAELRKNLGNLAGNSTEYVEPFLRERGQTVGTNDSGHNNQQVSMQDVAGARANFVIHSTPEAGATTFLTELAAQIYEKSSDDGVSRAAFLVNYEVGLRSKPVLERVVKRSLPDIVRQNHSYETLKEFAALTILFDNVPNSSSCINQLIKDTESCFPNCRIILLLKSEILVPQDMGIATPESSRFRQVHLLPLDRSRARKVVQSYSFTDGNVDKDQILDEIVTRFRSLGIPMTHVFLTLYLTVIDRSPSFNPVNTSTLIDHFVSAVLERSRARNIFRGEFDYDNQRSALAALAEYFCHSRRDSARYSDVVKVIDEHLEEIGIMTDVGDLIATFVNSKILYRFDDRVGFSSALFLHYFIAVRMGEREEFFEWVFEDQRCLSYVNVVEIYCGLNRSDSRPLNKAEAIYDGYWTLAEQELGSAGFRHKVTEIPINSDKLEQRLAEDVKRAEEYTKDRDLAAQQISESEGTVEGSAASIPEDTVTSHVIRTVLSLALLSVCTKNLENLKREQKEASLSKCVRGWGLLASVATYGMAIFVKDRTPVKIGDLLVTVVVPEDVKAGVLRDITTSVPAMVADRMRMFLGTEKLKLLLSTGCYDEVIDDYMRRCLLLEFSGNSDLEDIEEFSKAVADSVFLSRALHRQLMARYLRIGTYSNSYSSDDDLRERQIIVGIEANCLQLKGPKRKAFINEKVQKLSRRNLLVATKEKAKNEKFDRNSSH